MGTVINTVRRVWTAGQPPDFAKIRKAILSGKPGRIGFTRFSHLAFYPPYRRSIDAKRRSAPGASRTTER